MPMYRRDQNSIESFSLREKAKIHGRNGSILGGLILSAAFLLLKTDELHLYQHILNGNYKIPPFLILFGVIGAAAGFFIGIEIGWRIDDYHRIKYFQHQNALMSKASKRLPDLFAKDLQIDLEEYFSAGSSGFMELMSDEIGTSIKKYLGSKNNLSEEEAKKVLINYYDEQEQNYHKRMNKQL